MGVPAGRMEGCGEVRTVKELVTVTCDVCGRSRSGHDSDCWREFLTDGVGPPEARRARPLDMCPDCYERVLATVMEIRKEAAK